MSGAPGVSILLVVKNERANLEKILPRIAEQAYAGPVEIVAIDSGSTDGTVELLAEHGARVEEIPPPDFHHGRTRNQAAALARHKILVLLSGDALPADEQWLGALVTPFADAAVGAVYGRQIPPDTIEPVRARYLASEYPLARVVREIGVGTRIHPGLFRFSNANAAVRRSVWERFRWNETLSLAEDQGLCRDVLMDGMKVVYEPAAAVLHGHGRGLWGEFQYAFDNGLSLARLGILNNPRIGGSTAYGLRRVREDLGYFLRRGRVDLAARATLVFMMKWLGVQAGKRGEWLPPWLLRRLSEVYSKGLPPR